jgi:endo-1,4-beta-xylanase
MMYRSQFIGRRDFLISLGALASVIPVMNQDLSDNDSPLRLRAANKGLIYGANPGMNAAAADQQFWTAFFQECGLMVIETFAGMIRPTEHSFDFTFPDTLSQLAEEQQLPTRGHPLIWHGNNPEWLEARFEDISTKSSQIEQILIDHVSTLVNRYAGRMNIWDVVNEAIELHDGREDGLGNRPWFNFLGYEYLDLAFQVAAEADPNALLFYNDFDLGIDDPTLSGVDGRRAAILALLERLKARGLPIHGFGLQFHLLGHAQSFDAEKLRIFLSDVASLGLKILVSEMDVIDNELTADIEERDRRVASVYEEYVSVILDEPAVMGINTWGISDRYTWLSQFAARSDGLPVRPLLLDDQMNRKKSWYAIASLLDQAPTRSPGLPSQSS